MCASYMTNPKAVNEYFIPTRQGLFLMMTTNDWPDAKNLIIITVRSKHYSHEHFCKYVEILKNAENTDIVIAVT